MAYVNGERGTIDQAFWTELDKKLNAKPGYSRAHFTSIYNRWGPQIPAEEVVEYARSLAREFGPGADPTFLVKEVIKRYPQISRKREILAQVRAACRVERPAVLKIEKPPKLPELPMIVRDAPNSSVPDGDTLELPSDVWGDDSADL